LQFTFAVFGTGCAITAMVGKQQLQNHFPVFPQLFGICFDYKAFFGHSGTGGIEPPPFIFKHTHTAGAVCRQLGIIAKRRHFNSLFTD
jgi:hypothetical protein